MLYIVDAVNKTDELIGSPCSGPDLRMIHEINKQAVGALISVHVIPITMCRSHIDGVDCQPQPQNVLGCMKNVLKIISEIDPVVIVLVGDLPEKYYGREFPEAIRINPMWLYRKHPAMLVNAITAIKEAYGAH